MKIIDWLDLALSRADQAFVAWNVFIVVSLGLIGFLTKIKVESHHLRERLRWPIIAGFSIFAISNLDALLSFRAQKEEFLCRAQTLLAPNKLAHMSSNPAEWLGAFHICLDLVIILVLMHLTKFKVDSNSTT